MASKDATSLALFAIAVTLALQIPTSIMAIANPLVRSGVMVLALVVVVVCALLAKPRDVATVLRDSLRPRDDRPERITFRPPAMPRIPPLEEEPDTRDERPPGKRR